MGASRTGRGTARRLRSRRHANRRLLLRASRHIRRETASSRPARRRAAALLTGPLAIDTITPNEQWRLRWVDREAQRRRSSRVRRPSARLAPMRSADERPFARAAWRERRPLLAGDHDGSSRCTVCGRRQYRAAQMRRVIDELDLSAAARFADRTYRPRQDRDPFVRRVRVRIGITAPSSLLLRTHRADRLPGLLPRSGLTGPGFAGAATSCSCGSRTFR